LVLPVFSAHLVSLFAPLVDEHRLGFSWFFIVKRWKFILKGFWLFQMELQKPIFCGLNVPLALTILDPLLFVDKLSLKVLNFWYSSWFLFRWLSFLMSTCRLASLPRIPPFILFFYRLSAHLMASCILAIILSLRPRPHSFLLLLVSRWLIVVLFFRCLLKLL
jgi:hypothetical protein